MDSSSCSQDWSALVLEVRTEYQNLGAGSGIGGYCENAPSALLTSVVGTVYTPRKALLSVLSS